MPVAHSPGFRRRAVELGADHADREEFKDLRFVPAQLVASGSDRSRRTRGLEQR